MGHDLLLTIFFAFDDASAKQYVDAMIYDRRTSLIDTNCRKDSPTSFA